MATFDAVAASPDVGQGRAPLFVHRNAAARQCQAGFAVRLEKEVRHSATAGGIKPIKAAKKDIRQSLAAFAASVAPSYLI